MWTDIFIQNKKHLLKTLDNFLKDINDIRKLIENENIRSIFIARNKKIRKSIIKLSSKKN